MNWDWWYYHRSLTLGVPASTLSLAGWFAARFDIALSLFLLALTLCEVGLWFYRWIEWRHPDLRPAGQVSAPDRSGPTNGQLFRRQTAI